ncbi:phage distal tail protein [Kitasatospora purpeofusca]|uniref:phage distal tail protein n=1 Tax=Kitasatospora purpeofusca TaxID=67352 RepID=UPI0036C44D75
MIPPYTGEAWTAEFGGVTMGGPSSVVLEEVSGLLDAPEVRTSDAELLQRDGLVPGTDYMGGRSVTLSVVALEPADVPALLTAFRPGGLERPFRFAFPGIAGGLGQFMARVRRRSAKVDDQYVAGARRFDVELFATDPRLYSGTDLPDRVEIPVRVPRQGSPIFPFSFPFDIGGPEDKVGYAAPNLVNWGSVPVFPVIRMTPRNGTALNPKLTVVKGGVRTEFATRGLPVPRGDTLLIDMAARRITLNGSSRFGMVLPQSQWFALEPGASLIHLDVEEGPDGLAASVEWRSAWM